MGVVFSDSVQARVPLTNTKDSLQKLDFDRSVCMAAICYSDPIKTMSSQITLLPWTTTHAQLCEDILSNKNIFLTRN